MASSGRKKGPYLPNGAEVHKLSASLTATGDHSFIPFSVLYRAPVCAVTHLYIYTHIHQGFSRKPARCNCGLCCCSSLAKFFVRPLLLTSIFPNVTTFQPPFLLTTVESTRFFSDHPLFYDVDVAALITKDPCLNSVQLPVGDEESAQEGTPSTHSQ